MKWMSELKYIHQIYRYIRTLLCFLVLRHFKPETLSQGIWVAVELFFVHLLTVILRINKTARLNDARRDTWWRHKRTICKKSVRDTHTDGQKDRRTDRRTIPFRRCFSHQKCDWGLFSKIHQGGQRYWNILEYTGNTWTGVGYWKIYWKRPFLGNILDK